jgi:putative membrane protein
MKRVPPHRPRNGPWTVAHRAAYLRQGRSLVDAAAKLTARTDRIFFLFNAAVSTAAIAVIAFILLREGTSAGGPDLSFVPAVNAVCNSLAALCLALGYVAIRRKAVHVHRVLMVTAFALSAVFLVGYLAYHFVHGDTRFTGTGFVRAVYFFVLITHVLLSITVVPLALTSFYFAFTRAFDRHRRLNRVFLPIWLYVSVTGVVIFFMLRA